MTPATRALVWPFALWLGGIALLLVLPGYDTPAWIYAGKTLLCAGMLAWLRPWRYVPMGKPSLGEWLLGAFIGFAVYVLWALPETLPYPAATAWYRRWLVMFPGSLPDYSASWCYAWQSHPVLATLKLLGSAFVIAPIEEFFFRGWLMRWLTQRDWAALPLAKVSPAAFWATVAVFAFEHDRVVGGALAGMAYGALACKTGSLRASIVAHIVTNLLLGIQVLVRSDYGFW